MFIMFSVSKIDNMGDKFPRASIRFGSTFNDSGTKVGTKCLMHDPENIPD